MALPRMFPSSKMTLKMLLFPSAWHWVQLLDFLQLPGSFHCGCEELLGLHWGSFPGLFKSCPWKAACGKTPTPIAVAMPGPFIFYQPENSLHPETSLSAVYHSPSGSIVCKTLRIHTRIRNWVSHLWQQPCV